MPAFYSATLPEFLHLSETELTGILSVAYANVGFTNQKTSQTLTWLSDLIRLRESLSVLLDRCNQALKWTLILEFEIPRKEKRIDVILLAGSKIIILELKSGFQPESLKQAEEYALLLHYFHRPSHRRKIIAVVVSPDAKMATNPPQLFLPIAEAPAYWIPPVRRVPWHQLTDFLLSIASEPSSDPIDSQDWLNGEYHPVPTIIDAARSLESGLQVREIAHARAARHDVEDLTSFIDQLIQRSKTEHHHAICFVTGVPGSGKTLVGLNLAFASGDSREPIHFMSGTGPLVEVLQAVLAHNYRKRTEARAPAATMYAKTLLENVHVFARNYAEKDTDRAPSNHVIIFDEAQRAWNKEQNRRKFGRDYSEPEMILRIMERHEDWSVIIALVGGGQEINSGEAGLGAWGQALLHTTQKTWDIYASPEAMNGSDSVAGSRLFTEGEKPANLSIENLLHLDVAVRSLKTDFYAEWVNYVIEGDASSAAALEAQKSFPIFLTRSLTEARRLLRENTLGESRCGLVGSSKATRLRAEGLEPDSSFHAEYPWVRWYLASSRDTRSSFQLEVFATEFEIQGLELDWIGLCWGGDYIWNNKESRWIPRKFNQMTSKWTEIAPDDQRLFRKNSYRVLLTRARQGIVIFVPTGNLDDPTRQPSEFDETATFLLKCGAQQATSAA